MERLPHEGSFFYAFFYHEATNLEGGEFVLSSYRARVATSGNENEEKCWNEPKTIITLHRQSDKTLIFDLLKQTRIKRFTPSTPECLLHQLSPY